MSKLGRNPLEKTKSKKARSEWLDQVPEKPFSAVSPARSEPANTIERIRRLQLQFDAQHFYDTVLADKVGPGLELLKKIRAGFKS